MPPPHLEKPRLIKTMNRNIIIANVLAAIGATGFIAAKVPPSALQGLLMVATNPAIAAGFSILDRKISKDTSRKRIDELEKDLSEKSKEFDRLSRQYESVTDELARLETTDGLFATKPVQREFNDLSHQIEQLNHELSVALHEKSELSDRLEGKHNDLVETEDNLLKMEAELLRIKENGGLQVQVAIRDRINAEREEALKSGMQAGVEQGNRKIDQLEGLSADLLGKVDYYANLLGQTAEEIEQLQTRIARDKAQLMNQSASELNARDRQLLQVQGLLDGNRVLRGTAEVERLGNKLHDEIESRYGIRLDIIDANRGATEDKFLFRREGNQPITIAEFKELVALAPEIRRSTGLYGGLTFNLPERGNKSLLEATAPWREVSLTNIKFESWDKLLANGKGFGFFGDSGSGKTCAAIEYLVQQTKRTPGQVIVLDIHAAETLDAEQGNKHWLQNKLSFIKDVDGCIAFLHEVLQEYKNRKSGKSKPTQLYIVIDEFGEFLTEIGDKLKDEVCELIRVLATGGSRKYKMNFVLINHSFNVAEMGIDSNIRTSLNCLLFNDIARKEVNTGQYDDKVKSFVRDFQGYKCVGYANATKAVVYKHPTHSSYEQVADGLEPKYTGNIQTLPLTIGGKNQHLINSNVSTQSLDAKNAVAENVQNPYTLTRKDYSDWQGGISGKNPGGKSGMIAMPSESNDVRDEQLKIKIAEAKRLGHSTLSKLIPFVFGDIYSNCENRNSSGFRKARAEYKRLTGE